MTTLAKRAHVLAPAATALAALAAGIGLYRSGIYRDNAFTTSGWWGTDIATLFVAVPLSLFLWYRRSIRAKLALIGVLAYLLYDAAFYAFGAALNDAFLLYVGVLALSLFALVMLVPELDRKAIARQTSASFPRRTLSGLFFVVGFGLAAVEISQVLTFALNGKLPDVVVNTGHPTHVVAVLDLTLVIPFFLFAAVLLLKRDAWGTVIGVALSVKGAIYMTGLVLSTLLVADAGFSDVRAQIPIWAVIGIGCAAAAFVLLHAVPERAATVHRHVGGRPAKAA